MTPIYYLDDSRQKRIAKCDALHYPSDPVLPVGTKPPKWFVCNPENPNVWNGPYDFLTYMGRDQKNYKSEIHADWDYGRSLAMVKFHNKLRDGGGDHDDQGFGIIDWDDYETEIHLANTMQNNTEPNFGITKGQKHIWT